jgi:hypothetical protein
MARRRATIVRRWLGTAAVLAGVSVLAAAPVGAHQPVFVTARNNTAGSGPLLVDGKVSYAIYGIIDKPGATRAVRSKLTAGDPLVVELLIPALDPEQHLAAADLPRVSVTEPNGRSRPLPSNLRVRFDEPFSHTSYVRVAQLREPAAQTGTYSFAITGNAPARFALATGYLEGVPGTVRGARPAPGDSVAHWYATAPPKPTNGAGRSIADVAAGRTTTRSGARGSSATVALLLAGGAAIVLAGFLVVRRRRPVTPPTTR